MFNEQLTSVQLFVVYFLPIMFAITLHEVAHGYMAYRFGDKTAKLLGRLSINPLRHIDLIGTIIVPMLLMFFGGIIFGWAKPVPINGRNLSNPKKNMAVIALAGPLANVFMALLWAIIAKLAMFGLASNSSVALPIIYMGFAGIKINIFFAILNLLPLPPLDGGHIIYGLLPNKIAIKYNKLAPYGLFLLLFLLMFGFLSTIIQPIAGFLFHAIKNIFML